MKVSHSTLLGSTPRANCPVNVPHFPCTGCLRGDLRSNYSDVRSLATRCLSCCLGPWTRSSTGSPVQFPTSLLRSACRHQHFFLRFLHSTAKSHDATIGRDGEETSVIKSRPQHGSNAWTRWKRAVSGPSFCHTGAAQAPKRDPPSQHSMVGGRRVLLSIAVISGLGFDSVLGG
jgi:hypothetical protein